MTSFTDQHRERFFALLHWELGCDETEAQPLWNELETAYREPHRSYHTAQHIIECLEHLDRYAEFILRTPRDPGLYRLDPGMYREETQDYLRAIELAVWWHDIIHQFDRQFVFSNERLSSSYAYITARETASNRYIADLILATDHTQEPGSVNVLNGDVIADIDLAILGAEPERFEQYEQQIAEEYRHFERYEQQFVEEYRRVRPQQYNEARSKFIQGMLNRPRIYRTDYFHDRFEARARKNLARLENRTHDR